MLQKGRIAGALSNLFAIDRRSLGMMRIGLALIVLMDLTVRAGTFAAHYAEQGVFPLSRGYLGPWPILFDIARQLPWVPLALFCVCAVSAFLMLIGRYSRTATVLVWASIFAIQQLDPLVYGMHDTLLRLALGIGIFLPWGRVWSLDVSRGAVSALPQRVCTPWTAVFLVQVALMYLFAAIEKETASWETGYAIYYAVSQYPGTALGHLLARFPDVLRPLTFGIHAFQYAVAPLLFFPVKTDRVRIVCVALLVLMHTSFALSLHIGLFSFVTYAVLVAFIPTSAWDTLASYVSRVSLARARYQRTTQRAVGAVNSANLVMRSISGIVAAMFIVLILIQFRTPSYVLLDHAPLREVARRVISVAGIEQQWSMFTTMLPNDNGWYVMRGTLADGTVVNAFNPGSPLPHDERGWEIYASDMRWRRYFISDTIRLHTDPQVTEYLLAYLCAQWNRGHTDTPMQSVEVAFMSRTVVSMTPPVYAPEAHVVWHQSYECR